MKIMLFLIILFTTFSNSFGKDFDFFKRKFSIVSNKKEHQCELKNLPNFCEQSDGHKIFIMNDSSNIAAPYLYLELDKNDNIITNTSLQVKADNNVTLSKINIKKMDPIDLLDLQFKIHNELQRVDARKEVAISSLMKKIDKEITELKPNDHFKIVDQNKETLDCSSLDQVSLMECSNIRCSSADKKKNYLLQIDLPKINSKSSFAVLKLEQNKHEILRDRDDIESFEIYHNNKKVSQTQKESFSTYYENKIFKDNPELEKNKKLVTFFSSNFYEASKSFMNKCSPKLKDIYENSSEHYNNLIAKLELKLTLDSFKNLNFTTPAEIDGSYCNLHGIYIERGNVESVYTLLNKFQSKVKPENGISLQKATELFNQYSKDDDFYWKYKADGCYARAELIAQDLAKQNIYSDKIWIQGFVDNGEPNTDIKWNYHVAPVVYIKDQKTKKLSEYVIDPALFDKPVPKEEWLNKTNKNTNKELIHSLVPGNTNAKNVSRNIYSISNRFLYEFSSTIPTESRQQDVLQEANHTIQGFRSQDEYLLKNATN